MTKQAPFKPTHTITRNADNPYHHGFADSLLMVCQDVEEFDCRERLDSLLIQIHALTCAVSTASDPDVTSTPLSQELQQRAWWAVKSLLEQAMMVNSYADLIDLHQKKGAAK